MDESMANRQDTAVATATTPDEAALIANQNEHLQLYPLPPPDNIMPRPLTSEEEARIDTLSRLQFVSRIYDSTESVPACTLMHCSSSPPPLLVGPMYPK